MVETRQISAHPGDVVLMVGTMKGAFLFRSNAARARWQGGGPHFPGHAVYAVGYDGRAGRRRIWAAPESSHFGGGLRASDDSALDRRKEATCASRRLGQLAGGRQVTPAGRRERQAYCGVARRVFERRKAARAGRWGEG